MLVERADALFAQDPRLVNTETSDPNKVQQTVHLIAPYQKAQVKAAPLSNQVAGTRTVPRLRTLALRKTTIPGGETSYELTDIDADDRNSDAEAWAKRRSYWDASGAPPVQKQRGVTAAGPSDSQYTLKGNDLQTLLGTLNGSSIWNSGRRTVLRTVSSDRLIARNALTGLRRVLALSREVAGSGWAQKD
jgi:hypothetical protein